MKYLYALCAVLMLTACGTQQKAKQQTEQTTEVTTDYVEAPELNANAETLTAYGQILNNACVYLNENYADKITGDVREEYDSACERLHNINLKGIGTFAQMSVDERNEVFSELEEIETCIFDSVAEKIDVKAELTEAVTTTADKRANSEASGELITSSEVETDTAAEQQTETETVAERLTAAE